MKAKAKDKKNLTGYSREHHMKEDILKVGVNSDKYCHFIYLFNSQSPRASEQGNVNMSVLVDIWTSHLIFPTKVALQNIRNITTATEVLVTISNGTCVLFILKSLS